MVSESILYNNRIWSIIMLLILTVMFCGFNSATIKAEKLGSNFDKTPVASVLPPTSNSTPAPLEPNVKTPQTPLSQPGFYHHPSGAFSFDTSGDWRLVSETDTMAIFTRGQAELGALFTNAGQTSDPKLLPDFRDTFTAGFLNFADDYTIVRQDVQTDQSISLTIRYHSAVEGDGQVNFLFEQHETVLFVLYLRTPAPAAHEATWPELMASYTVK